jgi:exopolysaccharide production protein ExoY
MNDVNANARASGVECLFVPAQKKLPASAVMSLFLKRALDIILASVAVFILAPLILMTMVVLLLIQGRPIFIAHRRIGRGGVNFPCLKFRTMVNNNEAVLENYFLANPGERQEWLRSRKLKNDPRVTPFGSFLRQSSLDEVPQFFNVILGHMSIVGPRPIVDSEVVFYGATYEDYIRVRPGLTGLWQISGRSDATYEKRVQLDAQYVANRTVLGDISIMARTIPAVLSARGSY